jgi:drug/metabolite transporter (DMT)-like permease
VSPVSVWIGLLTLYVVWGTTYLAIRLAIDSFPPYLMIAVRFSLAGAMLCGWSLLDGDVRAHPPTRREWRDSAIVGTLLLCGGMGLVAWAEQTLPTGIVALLVALMPAWVAVLGRVFYGERLVPLVVVGLLVGILGVAVLVAPSTSGSLDPWGLAAVLVSPILWSSGSLYSAHRARLPRAPLLASGMQMLTASVVSFGIALVLGEFRDFRVASVTAESLVALAYLVVVGSIVGFVAYVWLLRVAPLSKVTTYAYVNPVVAFVMGAIVLGEPITARTVVAAAIIVVAVALIVTARGRVSPAEEAEAGLAEAEGAGGAVAIEGWERAAGPVLTGEGSAARPAIGEAVAFDATFDDG